MVRKRKPNEASAGISTPEKKTRVTRTAVIKKLISTPPKSGDGQRDTNRAENAAGLYGATYESRSQWKASKDASFFSRGSPLKEPHQILTSRPEMYVSESGEKLLKHKNVMKRLIGTVHPFQKEKSEDGMKKPKSPASPDLSSKHHHAVHGVLRKSPNKASPVASRKLPVKKSPSAPGKVGAKGKNQKQSMIRKKVSNDNLRRKSAIPVGRKTYQNLRSTRNKRNDCEVDKNHGSFSDRRLSPRKDMMGTTKRKIDKASLKSSGQSGVASGKPKSTLPPAGDLDASRKGPTDSMGVSNNFMQAFRNFIGPNVKGVPSDFMQAYKNFTGSHGGDTQNDFMQAYKDFIGSHGKDVPNNFMQVYKNFIASHESLMPPLGVLGDDSTIAGEKPSSNRQAAGDSSHISTVGLVGKDKKESSGVESTGLNLIEMKTHQQRITRRQLKEGGSDMILTAPRKDPETIGRIKKTKSPLSKTSLHRNITGRKTGGGPRLKYMLLSHDATKKMDDERDRQTSSSEISSSVRGEESSIERVFGSDGEKDCEHKTGNEVSSTNSSVDIPNQNTKTLPKPQRVQLLRNQDPSLQVPSHFEDCLAAPAPRRVLQQMAVNDMDQNDGSPVRKQAFGSDVEMDCENKTEEQMRSGNPSVDKTVQSTKTLPKPHRVQVLTNQEQPLQDSSHEEKRLTAPAPRKVLQEMTANTTDKKDGSQVRKVSSNVPTTNVVQRISSSGFNVPENPPNKISATSASVSNSRSVAVPGSKSSTAKCSVSCQAGSSTPAIPGIPPFVAQSSSRRMVIIMDDDDEFPQDRWVLIRNPDDQVQSMLHDVMQSRFADRKDSHALPKHECISNIPEASSVDSRTQPVSGVDATSSQAEASPGIAGISPEGCGKGSQVALPQKEVVPKLLPAPHSSSSLESSSGDASSHTTDTGMEVPPLPSDLITAGCQTVSAKDDEPSSERIVENFEIAESKRNSKQGSNDYGNIKKSSALTPRPIVSPSQPQSEITPDSTENDKLVSSSDKPPDQTSTETEAASSVNVLNPDPAPSTNTTYTCSPVSQSHERKPALDHSGVSSIESFMVPQEASTPKDQTAKNTPTTNEHVELEKSQNVDELSKKNNSQMESDMAVMSTTADSGCSLSQLNQALFPDESMLPSEDGMSTLKESDKKDLDETVVQSSDTVTASEAESTADKTKITVTESAKDESQKNTSSDSFKLVKVPAGTEGSTDWNSIDEWGEITDYLLNATLQSNQLENGEADVKELVAGTEDGDANVEKQNSATTDSDGNIQKKERNSTKEGGDRNNTKEAGDRNSTKEAGDVGNNHPDSNSDTQDISDDCDGKQDQVVSNNAAQDQISNSAMNVTPKLSPNELESANDEESSVIPRTAPGLRNASQKSSTSSSAIPVAQTTPRISRPSSKSRKTPAKWRELLNLQDCFSESLASNWQHSKTKTPRNLRPTPAKTQLFQCTPGKATTVADDGTTDKENVEKKTKLPFDIKSTPLKSKKSKIPTHKLSRKLKEQIEEDLGSRKSQKERSDDSSDLDLGPWKTGKKAAAWDLKKKQLEIEKAQEVKVKALEIDEEPHLGELVWAHLGSQRWWPAVVIHGSQAGVKPASRNRSWVFWYGDHKISQLSHSKMVPFAPNFNQHYSQTGNKVFQKAAVEILQECASRAARDITDPDDLIIWGCAGCLGQMDVDPNPTCPVPQFALEFLRKIAEQNSRSDSDSDSDEEEYNLFRIEKAQKKKESCLRTVRAGAVDITEVCIICDISGRTIAAQHPLFNGGLCQRCLTDLMDTMFAIGGDGLNVYCVICGNAGDLYVCDDPVCNRVYCTGCILELAGDKVWKHISSCDTWLCFLCTPPRPNTHGLLVPKNNWRQNIVDLFTPAGMFQPQVPAVFDCQPIRVLSLFDGIGTGRLILSELGIEVESYLASEVDPDAIMVTRVRHQDVTHIGDITALDHSKLASFAPVDLLFGGSPCNEISIANPARKGLEGGTGTLFFEFHRVMRVIQDFNKGRHLFWLFENVSPMPTDIKKTISRFLGCEPAMWDAKFFSAQKRARYFWGNIPGMYCPPESSLIGTDTSKADLNDVLMPSRVATVKKVRTVTTKVNSLIQGKAERTFPVQMGSTGDTLWIPEMERMFGFPDHYTDVGNLPVTRRHKILGKSWSIPVMKHLLRPLRRFFKTTDGSKEGQKK